MIKTQILVQAIAFHGTQDEKVFTLEIKDSIDKELLQQGLATVLVQAQAYEQENKSTALFAAIEAKNGKKLTKPQRELLLLALEIQDGTGKTETLQEQPDTSTSTEKPEPSKETKDSSIVSTISVQEQPEAEGLEDEQTETGTPSKADTSNECVEQTDKSLEQVDETGDSEEPTNTALEDAVNESLPDDSDGIDDALAALGL